MKEPLPAFLLGPPSSPVLRRRVAWPSHALDQGIVHLARLIQDAYVQWDTAGRRGLLQSLSPAVKVMLWVLALAGVSVLSGPAAQGAAAAALFVLVMASRVRARDFYPRVLAMSILFGLIIPLPSLLMKPAGTSLPYHLSLAGLLFTRSFNSLTLTFLFLWTTPFPKLLRGFRALRIPEPMLGVLSLTRQYLFLFARTVQDMHIARKSRQITRAKPGDLQGWEARRIADLWSMTRTRGDDVACAMRSRTIRSEPARREGER